MNWPSALVAVAIIAAFTFLVIKGFTSILMSLGVFLFVIFLLILL